MYVYAHILLGPFIFASIYMISGMPIWNWITHYGTHPQG